MDFQLTKTILALPKSEHVGNEGEINTKIK